MEVNKENSIQQYEEIAREKKMCIKRKIPNSIFSILNILLGIILYIYIHT